MADTIRITNATLITLNDQDQITQENLTVSDGVIQAIGSTSLPATEVFDASQYLVLPGFVQTHVHLCQVLFRNLADDLSLLDWLKRKIWPFEAAHTEHTLRLSARLGLAELIKGGTTTILDMGTVNHHHVVFEELAHSGIRAVSGKAMMDFGERPQGLRETTQESIEKSLALLKTWHNYDNGRLKYAFTPRFALSCTPELLQEAGRLAKEHNTLYHTHSSENKEEVELVQKRFGYSNVTLFEKLGVAGHNLCLAHCIWTSQEERELMSAHDIKVLHCPSANLKLGSGIAPIPDYLERGLTVSLGADGAPCNNNLDMFIEMRLAALIQKPIHGPRSMPAKEVLKMATINGAKTLGLDQWIGSIEVGKRADLIFIKKDQVHSIPYENVYSKIVYSTHASDVEHVMVNGRWLMRSRKLLTIDEEHLLEQIQPALAQFENL